MPTHNVEIADKFNRLADLLEIEDANPFRVRAYRNAARLISDMPKNMADLIAEGENPALLPGIGEDLAGKIRSIVETGSLPALEEVETRVPASLSRVMEIGGLGPKRVKALFRELGVRNPEDLQRAAERGRIRTLEGFGPKTEQLILNRLASMAAAEGTERYRLIDAERIAQPLIAWLEGAEGLKTIDLAGSYRRRKETVGDLDILVVAAKGRKVMQRLVEYEDVAEVLSHGTTRSSVILRSGMQVDVRVLPAVGYGAAMIYFTGSKAHNIAIRKLAVNRGWKINEYGVFRKDRRLAGKTEDEVYRKIGLRFIEPELREDRGEIEAARTDTLPKLLVREDLCGDLHCHTRASDGRDSLETLVAAAADAGLRYIAISDHSRHLSMVQGLTEADLRKQIEAIDRLQERLGDGFRILKSIEVDILKDGTLDLPDSVLKELDIVVCSIHSEFDLPGRQQTERILRAMDNPHFDILAHPTGRILGKRPAFEVNLERVIDAAAERGCFLELNAHPDRLDLTDEGCRLAKEHGVKVAISTDAHSADGLAMIRFGVDQARRGWLTAEDVLNTHSWPELRALLRRR